MRYRILALLVALVSLCAVAPASMTSKASAAVRFALMIGVRDANLSLTTTPYKAFTTTPGSSFRAAIDIGTAQANTAAVYVLCLPRGSTAPANLAAIQADPTSYVLNPGDRLIGSAIDTDYNSDIYAASGSGTQAITFVEKSTSAPITGVSRFASSLAGSAFSYTAPLGSTVTVPPASFLSGTNWTSSSSTPLPTNIKAIWIGISPGSTCTLEFDGGGATGVLQTFTQPGFIAVPPGVNLTKIYSSANGSAGLVIAYVVS